MWYTLSFSPPSVLYPEKMPLGKTLAFFSTVNYSDYHGMLLNAGTLLKTLTLEGVEDVTVPAGHFADCLRITRLRTTIYANDESGQTCRNTEFLAKGVGLIKQRIHCTLTTSADATSSSYEERELFSAVIGGLSYPQRR